MVNTIICSLQINSRDHTTYILLPNYRKSNEKERGVEREGRKRERGGYVYISGREGPEGREGGMRRERGGGGGRKEGGEVRKRYRS